MEEDTTPKPAEEINIVDKLIIDLQNLVVKYNTDMTTLNRILSTYEDELSSLKNQFHELSFKYKQLNTTLTQGE